MQRRSNLHAIAQRAADVGGCVIFAFSILASCAACGYEEPVYAVTVTAGTNSLDEAMVEVTQNGETTSAAFSSLTLDQGGTFVKKGMGWLQSSTAMSVFTGEVVVAEGALILTEDGQAGATIGGTTKYRTSWSDCARLVVSNGATLALITPDQNTWARLIQPVVLSGEGLNGLGAIYHVSAASSDKGTQLYYSHVTLLGDTKIVYANGGRVGIGYCIVDMNGHDLTCTTRGSTRGNQVLCGLQVKNPGNILADHTQLYFSASKKWEGTAENTVTLTNNPYFRMYNFGGEIHWTLVNAHEGLVGYAQDSSSSVTYDDPDQNIWHGPWRLDKSMYIGANSTGTDNYGTVLAGAVSGEGGITLRHHWLRLKSKSNTFKGGVTVTTSGHLVLYGNGSLPADGGTLKLINGGEVLFDEANADALSLSTMEYPAIDWTVPSGATLSLPSCTNTIVKSLVKRGAGTLDLSGKIAVTGVTEIAAGTLCIPFEQAGLCEGWVTTNGTGQTSGSKNLGSLQYGATNRIASGTDLAYTNSAVLWQRSSPLPHWGYLLSYHGYIWNRKPTDATWVIAQEMWKGSYLYIDGVRCKGYAVPGQTSGTEVSYYHGGSPNDNKRVTFYTVTVPPGPHRIDMRTYANSSSFSNGGYGPVCYMPTNAFWKANFGWAIDWDGTMSTNCADYAEMRDPGDGSLFTTTTNGMDDVLSALVPKFDNLKFSGGTLDARGSSLSVKTLECGAGMLTNSNAYAANGTLTVGEKLKVDGASYVGDTLKIQGRLKFAAGATIDGEGLSLLKHDDYVLVEATDGIEGMPALGGSASGDRGWHLGKATVDGVETLTLGWRLGMTIIIK